MADEKHKLKAEICTCLTLIFISSLLTISPVSLFSLFSQDSNYQDSPESRSYSWNLNRVGINHVGGSVG